MQAPVADSPSMPDPDLRFGCTSCGRCCHGLRLALGISEAILWLERGGKVELLCDAAPDLPPAAGSAEDYRAQRAVPGISGALPVTIQATLTAVFDGPCPNLMPDMRCGAYDVRPNVCRIYPAEIRPQRRIVPDDKLCPTHAWDLDQPLFAAGGERILDETTATAIDAMRAQGVADVAAKAHLLALIGVDQVALANEGFTSWRPDRDDLLQSLRIAHAGAQAQPPQPVTIVSARPETQHMIDEAEAACGTPDPAAGYDYIPLYS